ncbi:MAG: ABC transporter permease, partial [Planctomycetota bacterium]
CFLPFVLSAPAIVREREDGTLESLLTSPGLRWYHILAGKSFASMATTLFTFTLLILLSQTFYQVFAKEGLILLMLLVVPVALASATLGLAVSAATTSQSQAMLASGIFFLSLTVFTGIHIPLSESSGAIQMISKFLPLTFFYPALQGWMVGAGLATIGPAEIGWVTAQCVTYSTLAALAFRRDLSKL